MNTCINLNRKNFQLLTQDHSGFSCPHLNLFQTNSLHYQSPMSNFQTPYLCPWRTVVVNWASKIFKKNVNRGSLSTLIYSSVRVKRRVVCKCARTCVRAVCSLCVCEKWPTCVCLCCTHKVFIQIYMLSVADLQTINTWHQEDTSKMWAYGPFKNQTRARGTRCCIRSFQEVSVVNSLSNRKQVVNRLKIPQGLSTLYLLCRRWSEVPSRGGVRGVSP